MSEALRNNRCKSVNQTDFHFLVSCIDEALSDEIQWPDAAERAELVAQSGIPADHPLFGTIGYIDGTTTP